MLVGRILFLEETVNYFRPLANPSLAGKLGVRTRLCRLTAIYLLFLCAKWQMGALQIPLPPGPLVLESRVVTPLVVLPPLATMSPTGHLLPNPRLRHLLCAYPSDLPLLWVTSMW